MPNVICDIAGQYDTLLALLRKMPDDEPISVGDMIDRGPKSKEVVKLFREKGRAVIGNHEHMMIDHQSGDGFYTEGIWLYNGGGPTLNSFEFNIPLDVTRWLRTRPVAIKVDDVLISHTFVMPDEYPDYTKFPHPDDHQDIVWKRKPPKRRQDCNYQVAGHNSHWGLRRFSDDQGEFAICIDTSAEKVLTGIHLPSMKIYQQEYI